MSTLQGGEADRRVRAGLRGDRGPGRQEHRPRQLGERQAKDSFLISFG